MTRSRKYKSTTYEAVIERINRGMSFEAIARELGCNPHHLRSAGSVLGIRSPYRPGRPPTTGKQTGAAIVIRAVAKAKKQAERDAILAGSLKADEPLQALADRLGVSKSTACKLRQIYIALHDA